jgi:type III pantothenate kinase
MMLFIDAGNTRIKWAVPSEGIAIDTHGERWAQLGEVAHADIDTLAIAWQSLPVKRVVISNVAGPIIRDKLHAVLTTVFGTDVVIEWFASTALRAGVRNGYQYPEKLGCDRFATLIGAHALFPGQAVIVATCGTATTVDTLDADGTFIGGMILPGLGMMATSLAVNTAQLPKVEAIHRSVTPFADNTADAIVSGCIAAQVGAIERVIVAHQAAYGPALCVVAGGAGSMLAPYFTHAPVLMDNMVLTGLHVATMTSTPTPY